MKSYNQLDNKLKQFYKDKKDKSIKITDYNFFSGLKYFMITYHKC